MTSRKIFCKRKIFLLFLLSSKFLQNPALSFRGCDNFAPNLEIGALTAIFAKVGVKDINFLKEPVSPRVVAGE